MTTSTSATSGSGFGANHVERLRNRAGAVTLVVSAVVFVLILAVQFTALSGGWLLAGGVATLLVAMIAGAYSRA